jgi:virginiamycin A acetyltransferase
MIQIAPSANVSTLADIEDSVRGSMVTIGEEVQIDAFVKIKFAGGQGDIVIGRGSFINSGTVIYSGNGIRIGEGVLIAANCTLAPVNHAFKAKSQTIRSQGFQPSRGGIIVEDDVWIGANSVLLDGAIVRRGCIVGAGSLVMGELEPFSINVGNPIRRVGFRK